MDYRQADSSLLSYMCFSFILGIHIGELLGHQALVAMTTSGHLSHLFSIRLQTVTPHFSQWICLFLSPPSRLEFDINQ